MTTLTPKNAERIATLFNSLVNGEYMLREGYTRRVWVASIAEAVTNLKSEFGIHPVGFDNYVREHAANTAVAEVA